MNIKRILNKAGLIVFVFIMILTIVPKIADSGVLSLFSNSNFKNSTNVVDFYANSHEFLSAQLITGSLEEVNSQNMFVLRAANHIDPNPAKGGGDINIVDNMALRSESGISGTTLDIEKATNNGRISLYEVREGDTLSEIAEMFGVSVNTIRWANDFSGPIRPGQSLVILPVSGLTHTVKNGGTIADVAEIYDADVREIALFNGLDEKVALKPGDKIIVPNVDARRDQQVQSSAATRSSSPSPVARTSPSPVSSQSSSSGYYINPVPGGIITQALHGYNAIDIAANYGTPILAAASGKVITSREGGWNGGYGNYVVISHDNGTQTLYSHNTRNTVYVGQYVEQGEVIGYMGSTGRSTGNHLHFETRGATNPIASCAVGSVCR